MEFLFNNLIEYVSLLGAPVVYAGLVVGMVIVIKYQKEANAKFSKRLDNTDNKLAEIDKLLIVIAQSTTKMEILHEGIPIEDRLKAYCKYIDLDGNGFIEEYKNEVLIPLARAKAKQMSNTH